MRPVRNVFQKLSRTEQRREGVVAYLEMGLWAPVLLWNPAILLLQNITKSIKTMLKLTFYPNTHVYQHNTHKVL